MSKSQAFEVNFLPSRQWSVCSVKKSSAALTTQWLWVSKAGNIALPAKRQSEDQASRSAY